MGWFKHKAKGKHPFLKALARHFEKIGDDLLNLLKNLLEGVGKLILQIMEAPEAVFVLILAVAIILISSAAWMRLGHLLESSAYVSYEVAHLVEKIVNGIISAINKLIGWLRFFIHRHVTIDELHFADKLDAYGDKATICRHFHKTMNVALFLPQVILNEHLCPVVRYTYGTPLWDIVANMLAFGYVDARPPPYGDNCAITEADVFCFVANGWRAWIYLAPLLVILYLAKPFSRAIGSAIKLAIDVLDTLLVIIITFLQNELFPHAVVLPPSNNARFALSVEHALGISAV